MWKEAIAQPLTVVHVDGLIVFAKDISVKEKISRQWTKLIGKNDRPWYETLDAASDITEDTMSEPIIVLDPNVRKLQQLRLFNVFTREEHTIPLQRIYAEVQYLGSDSPVIYPQDVVENTMCPQFLLFLQIHTRRDTLLMVWDLDRNCSKWKSQASNAVCGENKKIMLLKFGNALVGYLAKPTDKFLYVLLDLATGDTVQEFSLDGYRNPLSSSRFSCQFTSFVFIAWEPQSCLSRFLSSPTAYITAPFNVYSISSGQKLYVLECPMHYPQDLMEPILPWFQRTDESERYWLFSCPAIFRGQDDSVKAVYIWDVVLQQWTILGSRCVEKPDHTIILDRGNGKLGMALLNADTVDLIGCEEDALALYRWNRVPTVKEAMNLPLSPRLQSVVGEDR